MLYNKRVSFLRRTKGPASRRECHPTTPASKGASQATRLVIIRKSVMKYISILELPSKEAIQLFAEKRDIAHYVEENYRHPQEDFLVVSDIPPVFVVSDGVTLDVMKLVESDKKYPKPSPAGNVAKIFCQAVVNGAQERYATFSERDIINIFKDANNEVAKYNQKVGKSDISGNITDYYAATGAFVIVKDSKAYWASICDSFIAHFDKEMNPKFISSGLCEPYAVINGEERMASHLESGVLSLEKGDWVFVFTDGFEHYVKHSDFLKLFKEQDRNIKKRIAKFSEMMNLKDPEKYGHERSLIAIMHG